MAKTSLMGDSLSPNPSPTGSVLGDAVVAAAPCTTDSAPVVRTSAERFMRKILFIAEPDPSVTDAKVNSLFEKSILISATRCLLAYVVFPIFAPALYAASSWGPAIGLTVGAVALVFDVAGMRRFWKANHRWRWHMTAIYAGIMVLVVILVINDIQYLLA